MRLHRTLLASTLILASSLVSSAATASEPDPQEGYYTMIAPGHYARCDAGSVDLVLSRDAILYVVEYDGSLVEVDTLDLGLPNVEETELRFTSEIASWGLEVSPEGQTTEVIPGTNPTISYVVTEEAAPTEYLFATLLEGSGRGQELPVPPTVRVKTKKTCPDGPTEPPQS